MRTPIDASAVLHLYRGFVQTATMWRQRLDVTANWAFPLSIGMATFALGEVRMSHLLFLLQGIVLVTSATLIEARQYRELRHAVWRQHVIEVGWFVPVLSGTETGDHWRALLAEDLERPRRPLRMSTAAGVRLRGRYLVLSYLLVAAWIAKVVVHPVPVNTAAEVLGRMTVGAMPGEVLAALVLVATVGVTIATLATPSLGRIETRGVNLSGHPIDSAEKRPPRDPDFPT